MGSARFIVSVIPWLAFVLVPCCRMDDNAQALKLCRQAESLDTTDPRGALELKRRIWEEFPTTGTPAAIECARRVRERMGRVRALVSHDKRGDIETVEGCAWAADAVEVFSGSVNPPYREHWALRLMERCVDVVGRAWTRDPDSRRYAELNERLKKLSDTAH